MDHGYIDLMEQAGARYVCFALETASPRLQKLLRKNINIEKLRDNLMYICARHPHVVVGLFTMLGFPTETEDEVIMTLDFIKSIKWTHFPSLYLLKIFPDTDMARFALDHGVSREDIERSVHLPFHQTSPTLPFSSSRARQYQASFMEEYFLLDERLKEVEDRLRSRDK